MIALLFTLLFTSPSHADPAPSCDGIVATQAQLDAYSATMFSSWSMADQNQYVTDRGTYIKTPEALADWNLLLNGERMAILQYTGGMYEDINSQLRKGPFQMQTQLIALCSALNKLPNFSGTVYRILTLSDDELTQLQATHTFMDPAFMSTSSSLVLIWKKPVLLTIHTTHGKNIAGISAHPEEDEVLLLPRSNFKVVDFKTNPPESGARFQYEITLDEAVAN